MTTHLFTTYYDDKRTGRRAEQIFCLMVNDSIFDRMYVLSDNVADPPFDGFCGTWIVSEQRPKYRDLVELAEICDPRDLVVLANCDMVIPRAAVDLIATSIMPMQAYCLTRYELGPSKFPVSSTMFPSPHRSAMSQDTWATLGPPRVTGGDYFFGVPGCDNRYAAELQAAGYEVLNPSHSIVTWHIHGGNCRTDTNTMRYLVPPPDLRVRAHRLGERPIYSTLAKPAKASMLPAD